MAQTPIGRFGGALSPVRPDDLAAAAIQAIMHLHSKLDWARLDDVILGPAPAIQRLLDRTGLELADIEFIELNEAFASQVLPVLRGLGLPEDAEHVNPNGGAIALGHPLGMSGARLVATAARPLVAAKGRYAICSMCVGVGQAIALLLENHR